MSYAATIGTFDGVHTGHRLVLDTLKDVAASHGYDSLIITFSNHPLDVVDPQRAPRLIMDPDLKNDILGATADKTVMLEFTPGLCALTAEEWLTRLRDDYDVRIIVLGYDNTFGCDGRSLTPEDYRKLCRRLGMECIIVAQRPDVSSSAVREAIQAGDLDSVERMGVTFIYSGIVSKGKQLGRTIGFPTANLLPDNDRLILPPPGVYATVAILPDGMRYPAVTNIGDNPTVSSSAPLSIETHILDFKGDLYGKPLALIFLSRIRGEKKFDSIESLRRGILSDAEEVRNIFTPAIRP